MNGQMMNLGSHTREDLKRLQSLDWQRKVLIAQTRIAEWYKHWQGQVYVSFSGGKDSTVLLHLVRQMYPDVPAVYCDTGLEYPEVREHVMRQKNVTVLRPKMDFRSVIDKYGYPVLSKELAQRINEARKNPEAKASKRFLTGLNPDGTETVYKATKKAKLLLNAPFKVSHLCCKVMKKQPFEKYSRNTKCKDINGMMAEESRRRATSYISFGCNAFKTKNPQSRPLMTWTEQDVLRYLQYYGLEIPSVYGEIIPAPIGEDTEGQCEMFGDGKLMTTGVNRTGCMFCMFGAHLEKEPNRFQRMKITHPKIYEYCLRPWDQGGLGMKEVLNYIGVAYE